MKGIVQVVVDLVLHFPPSSGVIELRNAYPMQSDKSYYGEQPRIKLQPYFFLMTSCDRSGREDDVQVSWPSNAGLCRWWGWETETARDRVNLGHVKQKHFRRQPSDSAVSRQPWLAAAFLFWFPPSPHLFLAKNLINRVLIWKAVFQHALLFSPEGNKPRIWEN